MASSIVLVIVDDLFFLAKINSTLKHLSLSSKVLTQRAAVQAYANTVDTPLFALVDLTLRADDAVAVIRALRASTSVGPITILAFGAHVAVDTRQQALEAGADRVVAKSVFAQQLPELIQQGITPQ